MHLVIILVIALVVLGPKRIPEAGRGLGEALRGFKDSVNAPPGETEQRLPPARGEDEER